MEHPAFVVELGRRGFRDLLRRRGEPPRRGRVRRDTRGRARRSPASSRRGPRAPGPGPVAGRARRRVTAGTRRDPLAQPDVVHGDRAAAGRGLLGEAHQVVDHRGGRDDRPAVARVGLGRLLEEAVVEQVRHRLDRHGQRRVQLLRRRKRSRGRAAGEHRGRQLGGVGQQGGELRGERALRRPGCPQWTSRTAGSAIAGADARRPGRSAAAEVQLDGLVRSRAVAGQAGEVEVERRRPTARSRPGAAGRGRAGAAECAATTRWSSPCRVSPTSEPSWPAPTCTNARKPGRVHARRRAAGTGPARAGAGRTARGRPPRSAGYCDTVVADQIGSAARMQREAGRPPRGSGRGTAAASACGSRTGTAAPAPRSRASRKRVTSVVDRRRRAADHGLVAAQLSWESTTSGRPASSSTTRRRGGADRGEREAGDDERVRVERRRGTRRPRRRRACRRRPSPSTRPGCGPATASGVTPSRPQRGVEQPAQLEAPRCPAGRRRRPRRRRGATAGRSGGRRRRSSSASSTSRPGKTKASLPPPGPSSGRSANQTSLRPRHGLPARDRLAGQRQPLLGRVDDRRAGRDRRRSVRVPGRSSRSRSSPTRPRPRAAAPVPARGRRPVPAPARGRLLQHDVGVDPAEAEGVDPGPAHRPRPTAVRCPTCEKRVVASAGCGSSQCRVGSRTPWCTARAALTSPAIPAAGIVCPIIDFTEPSTAQRRAGPNTSARVASSAASPAGVAVPCASSSPSESGAAGSRPGGRPRLPDRADLAAGVRVGQAGGPAVAGHAGAADHGVDAVAVALGVGQALEHDDAGALADQDAVGVAVERPDPLARRQRAELGEHAPERDVVAVVHAAGEHDVAAAGRQLAHRVVDGDQRGRAGGVHRVRRAAQVEPVGQPGRGQVGHQPDRGLRCLRPELVGEGLRGRASSRVCVEVRQQLAERADKLARGPDALVEPDQARASGSRRGRARRRRVPGRRAAGPGRPRPRRPAPRPAARSAGRVRCRPPSSA